MIAHTTLVGKTILLEQLTAGELDTYFEAVRLAGGWKLLEVDSESSEATALVELEPDVFETTVEVLYRRATRGLELSEPFSAILHDLRNRVSIAVGRTTRRKALHDPCAFLNDLYDEEGSLGALSEATGLDKSQLSRLLRGESGVRLSTLVEVAERAGVVFEFSRVSPDNDENDDAGSLHRISLRDRFQQALGQRLQAIVSYLHTQEGDFLNQLLETSILPEFRARAGQDRDSFRTALRRAESNWLQLTAASSGDVGRELNVIYFRGDAVAELAWLFIAVELGWFEEAGVAALLSLEDLQTEASEEERPKELKIDPVSVGEQNRSWMATYQELIEQPILSAYSGEGVSPQSSENLETILHDLRIKAAQLLCTPNLRPLGQSIIGRWTRAFQLETPSIVAVQEALSQSIAHDSLGRQLIRTRVIGRSWGEESVGGFEIDLSEFDEAARPAGSGSGDPPRSPIYRTAQRARQRATAGVCG